MLGQKENLLRMLDGEMPEYVPVPGFGPGKAPLTAFGEPSILGTFRGKEGGYDPWGVHYVANKETNYAAIPEPNNFILKDITRWDEYIKAPEQFKNFDWEKAAEDDRAKVKYDPEKTLFMSKGFDDYFQQYIGMMGFTEGLMALYEEPECVAALLDFMVEQTIDITKNVLHYYKPEAYYILDDSASKLTPFCSRETFEELFVPRYKKTLDLVRDAGIPVFYHNCGRCEDFLPAMVKLGVRVWDPAQTENDLVEVKNKFGRQLIIQGGFEYFLPPDPSVVTEEEVREAVRKRFSELAPNGSWIFSGMAVSTNYMDPVVQKINGWIRDEAEKLSVEVYK